MDGAAFIAQLVEEMEALFARLGDRQTLEAEPGTRPEVVPLLKLALTSELEAAELAGYWLPGTREIEAKMVFAQQCGDEMKHYRLIEDRLRELGEDLDAFDPLAGGYSPLYRYLKGLRTTIEQVAAGPFAGEAVAQVRNLQFIEFCRAVGDDATARLYDEIIQPDEIHHHRLARRYLERHADDPESQERCAVATRTALAIADELRTLAEKTTGMLNIPTS